MSSDRDSPPPDDPLTQRGGPMHTAQAGQRTQQSATHAQRAPLSATHIRGSAEAVAAATMLALHQMLDGESALLDSMAPPSPRKPAPRAAAAAAAESASAAGGARQRQAPSASSGSKAIGQGRLRADSSAASKAAALSGPTPSSKGQQQQSRAASSTSTSAAPSLQRSKQSAVGAAPSSSSSPLSLSPPSSSGPSAPPMAPSSSSAAASEHTLSRTRKSSDNRHEPHKTLKQRTRRGAAGQHDAAAHTPASGAAQFKGTAAASAAASAHKPQSASRAVPSSSSSSSAAAAPFSASTPRALSSSDQSGGLVLLHPTAPPPRKPLQSSPSSSSAEPDGPAGAASNESQPPSSSSAGGPSLSCSVTAAPAVWFGVMCADCGQSPLSGVRFHCTVCADADLCAKCHDEGLHTHPMQRWISPAEQQPPSLQAAPPANGSASGAVSESTASHPRPSCSPVAVASRSTPDPDAYAQELRDDDAGEELPEGHVPNCIHIVLDHDDDDDDDDADAEMGDAAAAVDGETAAASPTEAGAAAAGLPTLQFGEFTLPRAILGDQPTHSVGSDEDDPGASSIPRASDDDESALPRRRHRRSVLADNDGGEDAQIALNDAAADPSSSSAEPNGPAGAANNEWPQPSSSSARGPSLSSSVTAAPAVWFGVKCDGCGQSPIIGACFRCTVCSDFDLCAGCEAKGSHAETHPMQRFNTPAELEQQLEAVQRKSAAPRATGYAASDAAAASIASQLPSSSAAAAGHSRSMAEPGADDAKQAAGDGPRLFADSESCDEDAAEDLFESPEPNKRDDSPSGGDHDALMDDATAEDNGAAASSHEGVRSAAASSASPVVALSSDYALPHKETGALLYRPIQRSVTHPAHVSSSKAYAEWVRLVGWAKLSEAQRRRGHLQQPHRASAHPRKPAKNAAKQRAPIRSRAKQQRGKQHRHSEQNDEHSGEDKKEEILAASSAAAAASGAGAGSAASSRCPSAGSVAKDGDQAGSDPASAADDNSAGGNGNDSSSGYESIPSRPNVIDCRGNQAQLAAKRAKWESQYGDHPGAEPEEEPLQRAQRRARVLTGKSYSNVKGRGKRTKQIAMEEANSDNGAAATTKAGTNGSSQPTVTSAAAPASSTSAPSNRQQLLLSHSPHEMSLLGDPAARSGASPAAAGGAQAAADAPPLASPLQAPAHAAAQAAFAPQMPITDTSEAAMHDISQPASTGGGAASSLATPPVDASAVGSSAKGKRKADSHDRPDHADRSGAGSGSAAAATASNRKRTRFEAPASVSPSTDETSPMQLDSDVEGENGSGPSALCDLAVNYCEDDDSSDASTSAAAAAAAPSSGSSAHESHQSGSSAIPLGHPMLPASSVAQGSHPHAHVAPQSAASRSSPAIDKSFLLRRLDETSTLELILAECIADPDKHTACLTAFNKGDITLDDLERDFETFFPPGRQSLLVDYKRITEGPCIKLQGRIRQRIEWKQQMDNDCMEVKREARAAGK